jgi:SAM-dependent methyltransferase
VLPYQRKMVDTFFKALPSGTKDILEIGSDIQCEVAIAIAERTSGIVVGINPSEEFPQNATSESNVNFFRGDGRNLPFPDNSFDAVFSVATMEHVNGLEPFLSEVARVLRPKGLFYTSFSPIWSSAKGHHVYAVSGSKEARFWKPGKNPIPDYGHLLMSPDEMREYLHSGPCAENLIDPIIRWVYFGDSLNRCRFEEYIDAFNKSPLIIQYMMGLGYNFPDRETLRKLKAKYGSKCNFNCSSISAILRKPPEDVNGFWFRTHIIFIRGLSLLKFFPLWMVLRIWSHLKGY